MSSHALNILRFQDHAHRYPQLKDPCLVRLPNGRWAMFTTICGSSAPLGVGRFVAQSLGGPWQELAPVAFHHLSGPELCAPALRLVPDRQRRKLRWEMYIQTSCFQRNGVIALATSSDGRNFFGTRTVASVATLERWGAPAVGLYDVSYSQLTLGGERLDALVYSGYRTLEGPGGRLAGMGDLYLSLRRPGQDWTAGRRVLAHHELPFHNQPGYPDYEWGLEGAKLLELSPGRFLLVGVCFLERPQRFDGQRQRVFMAAARSPFGPFVPVGAPLEPMAMGETGHPDAVLEGERLVLVYQERASSQSPWHLRQREVPLAELRDAVEVALAGAPRLRPLRDPATPPSLDAPSLTSPGFATPSLAARGCSSPSPSAPSSAPINPGPMIPTSINPASISLAPMPPVPLPPAPSLNEPGQGAD